MIRFFTDSFFKHTMKKELSTEQIEELKKRHIRSFVMRRGHISCAQERALEELLPKYLVAYEKKFIVPETLFNRKAPLVLEIGFGMGETTAAIATAHPEIDFLGCEVFAAGVGALCKRIEENALTNIRIARHDAVEVVRDMIAPNSLAGVHIFFPDPWRKARHHKRRLIQGPFVKMLAERIAPGGYLHCATDWENYAEQMLAVLQSEPLLKRFHEEGSSNIQANPLCERPKTKFQTRGENLGYAIWDFVYTRL